MMMMMMHDNLDNLVSNAFSFMALHWPRIAQLPLKFLGHQFKNIISELTIKQGFTHSAGAPGDILFMMEQSLFKYDNL